MEALNKLIEAVASGEGPGNHCLFLEVDQIKWCVDAWRGSLDAATALHEAPLPGVSVTLTFDSDDAVVTTHYPDFGGAMSSNPARAWLLAILRARAAQSEGEA